ncbi:MAG TPA: WYL domain-containing protein [Pseudonocardia sp.]|nr:WYL domain-containing protein [Pseudonocardia sp.]
MSIPKAGAHRAGPQVDPAVLLALGDAIRAREELRFGYRSPTGDEQDAPRRVQPQHLVVRAGRWYHPSSGPPSPISPAGPAGPPSGEAWTPTLKVPAV